MTPLKKAIQRRGVQRLFWVFILLLIWQLVALSGKVSPLLLPPPAAVLRTLFFCFAQGSLFAQVGFSLGIILLGMVISLAGSLVLAVLSMYSKVIASLTDTLCALAHPLPAVALMPLIIVWFGIGFWAITAIIVHAVIWPILLNLLAGFKSVSPVYIESGRSLNASRTWLLFNVYLPAAATQLIAGIKIGWARAWRALISAEMIFGAVGGTGGIGWYLFTSRVMMDTESLFAGVLVVVLIGMLVEEALQTVERKTVVRWGLATGG